MKDIDVFGTETKKIHEWACKYGGDHMWKCYFGEIDKEAGSYFERTRSEESEMTRYYYKTAAELEQELDRMWDKDDVMREIIKPVLVAAMKGERIVNECDTADTKSGIEDELKDYVYNFF